MGYRASSQVCRVQVSLFPVRISDGIFLQVQKVGLLPVIFSWTAIRSAISRSVDKKPFVGDLQFGIAVTWSNVRLSYTHVLRTREFKTQDERDDFGALSLSIRLRYSPTPLPRVPQNYLTIYSPLFFIIVAFLIKMIEITHPK